VVVEPHGSWRGLVDSQKGPVSSKCGSEHVHGLFGPAGSRLGSWFMANSWMVLGWIAVVLVDVAEVVCNGP
jgi:hypothetical protein